MIVKVLRQDERFRKKNYLLFLYEMKLEKIVLTLNMEFFVVHSQIVVMF